MRFSFSLLAALILSVPSLAAQDLTNSWNTRFPVPGVRHTVEAVAVEGEGIAVLTEKGIQVRLDGKWSELITLPEKNLAYLSHNKPLRILALSDGEPWIAGEDALYRYSNSQWDSIQYPESTRTVDGPYELAVVGGDLFLTPDLHRWSGNEWESLLPENIAIATTAVVSASGRRWLINENLLLEEGDLRSIGAPPQHPDDRYPGVAFAGEDPVVRGHRYQNGIWSELTYPSEFQPFYESIPALPIVGGKSLYAVSPVWDLTVVASISGGGSYGIPCTNRLYRLEGTVWRPVSGRLDKPARVVASWGDSGAIFGGSFLSDGEHFVADRIVDYNGAIWNQLDTTPVLPYTGITGSIKDVALSESQLWVAGNELYTNGLAESTPILLYENHTWHSVEGILRHS